MASWPAPKKGKGPTDWSPDGMEKAVEGKEGTMAVYLPESGVQCRLR